MNGVPGEGGMVKWGNGYGMLLGHRGGGPGKVHVRRSGERGSGRRRLGKHWLESFEGQFEVKFPSVWLDSVWDAKGLWHEESGSEEGMGSGREVSEGQSGRPGHLVMLPRVLCVDVSRGRLEVGFGDGDLTGLSDKSCDR